MEESALIETEIVNPSDAHSDLPNGSALFQRRVEFHPARKPFKGFHNSGSDFKLETLNPCSSSDPRRPASASASGPGTSGLGGKRHDGSEFSEYGLDPELNFGITFRRIGAGLWNLGNTCFLNSVLQCLTYTEPLAAYLQSGKHKSSCHIAGFCALCAIQNHVSRALQSTGRILSPDDLVVNLRCISRNFRNSRQEDAHEYMVNLLESMHKCCLPSGVPSESSSAYEKSLVHKIFGGRLRSQVKCQQCSYCSNKFDPFLDLSLEIFKADTLNKALANFTAAEWLDGGERQYQCQRCKQKVKALKQLTIHKAPYVLTIHLKRFYAHDPGQKIKKKVQFSCALDMKPFVSGSYEGDLKYSLYGVLVHSGSSTHSGHYYCYVRTSNNMWYTLDDNRVSHVSEREVLNQQAYMLFYVRDRKNVIPRKPVDIAQKDMKRNVNGNRASTMLNQVLKEPVHNGPAEKKFNGAASSTAEAQKNTLSVDSLRVSVLNDASAQQQSSMILTESLMQSKDSVSESSSRVLSHKDLSKGLSVGKSERDLSSLGQSGKNCNHPHNLQNLVAPTGESMNRSNENEVSKENMKDTLPVAPSVSVSQNFTAKLVSETSQKNFVSKVDVVGPVDSSISTSNTTGPVTSLIQPSNENSQVGGSATGSVSDKASSMVHDKAAVDRELVPDESVYRSLDMESPKYRHLKKSKKKLLRCQASSIHLRPSFFFLASLGLRKKKHKRSKRNTLNVRILKKEKLDTHVDMSEAEPSISGETGVASLGLSCLKCRATESGYKQGAKTPLNSNDDSLMENIAEGEFRKRIDQSSAVLATAKQVEKISSRGSVVIQCGARQLDCLQDGKRNQMHNGLMSMLTQGLKETVVACWDDIDLPPSQSAESKNDKIISIGYVGDEWDEEYDTGKRKKLRGSKHSFGGPNLFQEIAIQKSQFKNAMVDHSSSGNPPFRI